MTRTQALHKLLIVTGLLFILLVAIQSHAGGTQHHQIEVELLPGLKMLKAQDTLTFPEGTPRKLSFLLHKELQVTVIGSDDHIVLLHAGTKEEPYSEYGLTLGAKDNKVILNFFGIIHDPVVNEMSRGLIAPEGATLFGTTYWYPVFLGQMKSFDVTVKTPESWMSLVQGQLISTGIQNKLRVSRFSEIYPQEEIYLVAGPFFSYEKTLGNGKKLQVLLRKDEPSLAQSFLNTMPEYVQHYSDMIAPYPYSQFTVVENFWETGYGMPSFTLLGPTVVRLPFILNSSLPHEILHNWWGNSVYVDYDRGNWSEGLTTYMADYWQQEKVGNDRGYRLNSLMSFSDFVTASPEKDFPLRNFRGRHNSSSQAVGYSKSMMLFHMLEFRLGKETFRKAIQDFYQKNLFQAVSFTEVQKSFESVTNQDLEGFFTQWLDRTGAPQLALNDVRVMHWLDGSFSSTYSLSQAGADVYDLVVPVIWKLENGEVVRQIARLTEKSQVFSLVSRSRPVHVAVDPDFHIFRSLYAEERPATLSSVLGSSLVHFYMDTNSVENGQFAAKWIQSIEGKKEIHNSTGSFDIPTEGALVLIGDGFAEFMKQQLVDQNFAVDAQKIQLEGQEFNLPEVSTVVVTRLKSNPTQTVVWIRWARDNNPAEWAGRLTHYGSFGVLVFKSRPVVYKSTWPVTSSPLQRKL
ncbi:M1 family metallopeptidase [Bdellovibrio sp. HCB2-146]|uniref:M1 family metallopeptidase n=1 Tax=Bdellovibrio sp. HCB2-146 TaxID=3394362 RepID=UPI0039BCBC84